MPSMPPAGAPRVGNTGPHAAAGRLRMTMAEEAWEPSSSRMRACRTERYLRRTRHNIAGAPAAAAPARWRDRAGPLALGLSLIDQCGALLTGRKVSHEQQSRLCPAGRAERHGRTPGGKGQPRSRARSHLQVPFFDYANGRATPVPRRARGAQRDAAMSMAPARGPHAKRPARDAIAQRRLQQACACLPGAADCLPRYVLYQCMRLRAFRSVNLPL